MRYDIMAPIRQYESNGETRTFWMKCGTLFTDDNGKPSGISLEGLPTCEVDKDTGEQRAWSGRLKVFEPRTNDRQPTRPAPPVEDDGADIPF